MMKMDLMASMLRFTIRNGLPHQPGCAYRVIVIMRIYQ